MKKIICNSALTVLFVFTSSHSFGSVQIDCAIQPKVVTYMTPATDEEKATTEAALATFKRFCSKTGGMSSGYIGGTLATHDNESGINIVNPPSGYNGNDFLFNE